MDIGEWESWLFQDRMSAPIRHDIEVHPPPMRFVTGSALRLLQYALLVCEVVSAPTALVLRHRDRGPGVDELCRRRY